MKYRIVITTYKDGAKGYKAQRWQWPWFWWQVGEYYEVKTIETVMSYIDKDYEDKLHSTPESFTVDYIYKP